MRCMLLRMYIINNQFNIKYNYYFIRNIHYCMLNNWLQYLHKFYIHYMLNKCWLSNNYYHNMLNIYRYLNRYCRFYNFNCKLKNKIIYKYLNIIHYLRKRSLKHTNSIFAHHYILYKSLNNFSKHLLSSISKMILKQHWLHTKIIQHLMNSNFNILMRSLNNIP